MHDTVGVYNLLRLLRSLHEAQFHSYFQAFRCLSVTVTNYPFHPKGTQESFCFQIHESGSYNIKNEIELIKSIKKPLPVSRLKHLEGAMIIESFN